jgi:hypothetical protein
MRLQETGEQTVSEMKQLDSIVDKIVEYQEMVPPNGKSG